MDSFPNVRFYRMYPSTIKPRPASRDCLGMLPHRAVQYCEAVTMASGFGYWLFSPLDCELMLDGADLFYRAEGMDWTQVADTAPFPGWPEGFYENAPPSASQVPPPAFLTAIPEGGIVQINLGVCAQAADGYGLLIRRPPNFPMQGGLDFFEGVIDPSCWFGSLFINVKITRTGMPVRLYSDRPLVQVQPIPMYLMDREAKRCEASDMGPEQWEAYATSFVASAMRDDRERGEYAAEVRRKVKGAGSCPVVHANAV